jgi:hypothetical protein
MECRLTPSFFKQEEAVTDEVLLMKLIEGEHLWQSKLDVGRKDSLRPIDQEETVSPVGLVALVGIDQRTCLTIS